MNKTIQLYSFGKNDRSSKVRWVAAELGLAIEEHAVELGAHRKFPYRDLNPYAAIPTVIWQDNTLIESTAICTFIAEKYPEKGLIIDINEPERACYLQWMAVCAETFETKLVEYYLSGKGLYPVETQALYQKGLEFKLRVLLEQMPKRGFLVAERLTLADITLCYSLGLAILTGLIEFSQVAEYMQPLMDLETANSANFFDSLNRFLAK